MAAPPSGKVTAAGWARVSARLATAAVLPASGVPPAAGVAPPGAWLLRGRAGSPSSPRGLLTGPGPAPPDAGPPAVWAGLAVVGGRGSSAPPWGELGVAAGGWDLGPVRGCGESRPRWRKRPLSAGRRAAPGAGGWPPQSGLRGWGGGTRLVPSTWPRVPGVLVHLPGVFFLACALVVCGDVPRGGYKALSVG